MLILSIFIRIQRKAFEREGSSFQIPLAESRCLAFPTNSNNESFIPTLTVRYTKRGNRLDASPRSKGNYPQRQWPNSCPLLVRGFSYLVPFELFGRRGGGERRGEITKGEIRRVMERPTSLIKRARGCGRVFLAPGGERQRTEISDPSLKRDVSPLVSIPASRITKSWRGEGVADKTSGKNRCIVRESVQEASPRGM